MDARHPFWASAFIALPDDELAVFIRIGVAVLVGVEATEFEDRRGVGLLHLMPPIAIIIFIISAELGRAWARERIAIVAVFGSGLFDGGDEALGAAAKRLIIRIERESVAAVRFFGIGTGGINGVARISIRIFIPPASGAFRVDRLGEARLFGARGARIAAVESAGFALIAIEGRERGDAELAKAGGDAALGTITRVAVAAFFILRARETAIVIAAIALGAVSIVAVFARGAVNVTVSAGRGHAFAVQADRAIAAGITVRAIDAFAAFIPRGVFARVLWIA